MIDLIFLGCFLIIVVKFQENCASIELKRSLVLVKALILRVIKLYLIKQYTLYESILLVFYF